MSTPWVDGPHELLKHGIEHLQRASDFDRLIAIISIDDAVELMLREYLRTHIPKEERTNFPQLLNLLRQRAPEKTSGVDLESVSRLHGLRNTIYHDGHGLTVRGHQVQLYADLAKVLISNLFAIDIKGTENKEDEITLLDFMLAWRDVEDELRQIASSHQISSTAQDGYLPVSMLVDALVQHHIVPESTLDRFEFLYNFYDNLVSGKIWPSDAQVKQCYDMAEALFEILEAL